LNFHQADEILNRKSGLLGISGISNDLRVINEAVKRKNKLASLAVDMFIYRIKKYIGAYYLILGGADAICFTAGIGENNPVIINKLKKSIMEIAPKKTKVLVVPTDEELMIADLTYKLIKKKKKK
jgi:acetate kinase